MFICMAVVQPWYNKGVKDHYEDVIMGAMTSQITSLTIVTQLFIQTQIKENIKALHHWPLCGEFTGDRWILRTNGPVMLKMSPFDDVIKWTLTLQVLSFTWNCPESFRPGEWTATATAKSIVIHYPLSEIRSDHLQQTLRLTQPRGDHQLTLSAT